MNDKHFIIYPMLGSLFIDSYTYRSRSVWRRMENALSFWNYALGIEAHLIARHVFNNLPRPAQAVAAKPTNLRRTPGLTFNT
jgi:hypothetical protein